MGELSDLRRKRARLRRARRKSNQKAFVMDSFMYEESLNDLMRNPYQYRKRRRR